MRKFGPDTSPPVPNLGEGKRGEDGHLGYLLRQAAHCFQLQMARALQDLEMTPPQFTVLTMIKAYPGISNADIARLALLTPQTVGVIITNLDKAGWIIRRPHAVHGRIKQVELSEDGLARFEVARQRVATVENVLSGVLSPTQDAEVRQWLVAVARTMTMTYPNPSLID
jgi:DNA-binding MarR family transcriptional regulator